MNHEFQTHRLNERGLKKAEMIAEAFDELLRKLTEPFSREESDRIAGNVLCSPGRETAIVRTKLEEACFFAKKAMASTGWDEQKP